MYRNRNRNTPFISFSLPTAGECLAWLSMLGHGLSRPHTSPRGLSPSRRGWRWRRPRRSRWPAWLPPRSSTPWTPLSLVSQHVTRLDRTDPMQRMQRMQRTPRLHALLFQERREQMALARLHWEERTEDTEGTKDTEGTEGTGQPQALRRCAQHALQRLARRRQQLQCHLGKLVSTCATKQRDGGSGEEEGRHAHTRKR